MTDTTIYVAAVSADLDATDPGVDVATAKLDIAVTGSADPTPASVAAITARNRHTRLGATNLPGHFGRCGPGLVAGVARSAADEAPGLLGGHGGPEAVGRGEMSSPGHAGGSRPGLLGW